MFIVVVQADRFHISDRRALSFLTSMSNEAYVSAGIALELSDKNETQLPTDDMSASYSIQIMLSISVVIASSEGLFEKCCAFIFKSSKGRF